MTSFVHQHGKLNILDRGDANIDLVGDTTTIKLMLLKDSYSDAAGNDPDRDFVDNVTTLDPIDEEADCTGYVQGFGNAGRHTIDNPAENVDDTDNEIEFDFDDEVWTALGNGTNNTLSGVGLIKEITNDAASPFIAFDDVGDVTTNGGNITYVVAAEGMLNF